jgi:hypothetical protein
MALAVLSIDLEARLARLESDLGKASRLTEREAKRMEQAFGAAGASLQRLAGTLGAGLSVAWLTTLAKNTIDGIDALNDLSDATGASIENLSALEDVAVRTGTSMETVGDAVVKLNKLLNDAKPGSDQAAALTAIGLSAAELKRQDPAQALLTTAMALARYRDDGDKARLVMELFGKSAAQLAPVLKDLADKGQLVATMTTEQAKATEAFNNQLNSLQKNATDAARAVAGPLVSAFNDFMVQARAASGDALTFGERLQRLYGASKSLGFGALIGLSTEETSDLDQARVELEAIEKALERTDLSAQRRDALEQKRIGRMATINKLQAEFNASAFRPSQNYGEAYRPSVGSLPNKPKSGGGKPEKLPFVFQGPELTASMAEALKRLDQVDSVKLAKLREELQLLTSLAVAGDPRAMEALPGVVEDIAKLEPEAKKAAEQMSRLNAILADTPSGQLSEVLQEIEFINSAFERGSISVEQWAEAVRVAAAKLPGDLKPVASKLENIANSLGMTFSSAFEDAVIEGEKLSDVLKSIEKDIARILLRELVTKPAAKGITDAVKDFDWGSLFGGPRAEGGPVQAGRAYLVGERGPEFIVPRTSGTVLPNGVAPGGGRPISVTIHMNGMSGGSQSTALQAGEAIGRQVRLALARNG